MYGLKTSRTLLVWQSARPTALHVRFFLTSTTTTMRNIVNHSARYSICYLPAAPAESFCIDGGKWVEDFCVSLLAMLMYFFLYKICGYGREHARWSEQHAAVLYPVLRWYRKVEDGV